MTKAYAKMIRSLSSGDGRRREGLFVVEGSKMVGEALASAFGVEKIYLCAEDPSAEAFKREHASHLAPGLAEYISQQEMERISHLTTRSGVLALVGMPGGGEEVLLSDERLVIALDKVQDPGNLGTIIRIADWFGVDDVVCSAGSADCYNPKVVQATMGAIFRVRVHYGDLTELLARAARGGVRVYGTYLEGDDIYRAELSRGGVIVMGSEGRGVSEQVTDAVTDKLYIPPYPPNGGASESLNVAMATAIVCSEFRRRL